MSILQRREAHLLWFAPRYEKLEVEGCILWSGKIGCPSREWDNRCSMPEHMLVDG